MSKLCNLSILVNGEETFFLHEKIVSVYSGKLKKMIKKEKRKNSSVIEIEDFPGGSDGFELVSRFCYNNGRIEITVSNVCLLHCCAIFLEMTDEKLVSNCNNNNNNKKKNLLKQTEIFLEGIFYWSWKDTIASLKTCESFFSSADSYGLIQELICGLSAKIAQNSDINLLASSSSSSSSPETAFRLSSSAKTTPESKHKPSFSSGKKWWFDDLSSLSPSIVEKLIKNLGAYGSDNNSLTLTKFILHYLKNRGGMRSGGHEYGGLAETAVYGVSLVGRSAFSCRGLFLILRNLSGFGMSKDCRGKLERLIGNFLDEATLDDLLISGHHERGVYDVNLVLRLIRIFVNGEMVSFERMKKVGRLIDQYLGEISPDHNLKMSKFLGVMESLPDSARDCFDGVYKAIDMYLQSHPTLPFEERSRICGCLNYEKLSLEACKDLAKNPRIPPNIAVEALKSQKCQLEEDDYNMNKDNEDMKINIQKMQRRVGELEKACREMKGQMSWLVKRNVIIAPSHSRTLPRLC
ncbi:hypothetical protein JCGZ_01662 [Jatropha curcas]|uniref:NPH3 domain-containing protein n=1 Tax=Jatropha curcas TaxID=180498 RepID=A0A067JSH7_JATCU|nr:BTB/POZ domain-containing protein At3g19850 [Jatropha curcas]KDP22965.1 hypothetical protein JCGZ_01662 [Jatropha curcas]